MISRKYLPGLVAKYIVDKNGVKRKIYVSPEEPQKQLPSKVPEKDSYELTYPFHATGNKIKAVIKPKQGKVWFYTTSKAGLDILVGHADYTNESKGVRQVKLNTSQLKDIFVSTTQQRQGWKELDDLVDVFHKKYMERHGTELQAQKEEAEYKQQQNRRQWQAFDKRQQRKQQQAQRVQQKQAEKLGQQFSHKQRNFLQQLTKHPFQNISYYPSSFEQASFKQETLKEARKLGIPSRNKTLNAAIDQVLKQAKQGKKPYTGD